jgi:AraC-like DNA-binding protein
MILLVYSSKKNVANYFLSLYFFIIGLNVLNLHAQINGNSTNFAAILILQFLPIFTLIGPSFYFYTHFFLYKKYRFTYLDFIHLGPALYIMVNEFPYLLIPFTEKIMVASLVHHQFNHQYLFPFALINGKMAFLFKNGISLLYLLYGYVLFFKFSQSENFQKLTTVERKRQCTWMFLFLLTSSVIYGGMMFAMVSAVKLTYYFYMSISGVGILFLIISLILFPSILYGRGFIIEPVQTIKCFIKLPKIILLSQRQFIEIDTLVAVFMVDLPYTRNDFNLNKVSLELGIPKYHLTYYLHTHLHLSFNSWRDQLRIIYAKGLITKGEAQSLTLEGIGKQSGFKSRDKFTRAFKAQTGSNPSDFLKNL